MKKNIYVHTHTHTHIQASGFPGGTSGKEPTCQCRRYKIPGFNPWVRKIPWRRAWQSTSVFLPGESSWTEEPGGLQSIWSETDMTEATWHTHMPIYTHISMCNWVTLLHIRNTHNIVNNYTLIKFMKKRILLDKVFILKPPQHNTLCSSSKPFCLIKMTPWNGYLS